MQLFHHYSWPGNVRELKNAVETAINQMQAGVITVGDLPRKIRQHENRRDVPGERKIMDLKEKVDEYERAIIAEELSKANGIIAETARRLGVSKQTLKYKLTKYELR